MGRHIIKQIITQINNDDTKYYSIVMDSTPDLSHNDQLAIVLRYCFRVERLVEDATLAGGAAVASEPDAPPRGDFKDHIYMEKLQCIDDKHSEKCGLTVNNIKATAARIEMRTANMVSPEPVCEDCKEKVIDCYCVQDVGAMRLRERTQKDALEHARRSRHVAHAREHALKDLNVPLARENIPS
ncbi:unnamed protein product [Diatraea saccharalis]|uniref:DUF4371 domain-containing protein n=1 Tax=Diatraea saccharalis TaxID=40085 RepID=A0A9P0C4H5_9NEOP|nr:unnamed protein product [Diatraea saccharalis]